jgi:hypothetical protein
MITDFAKPIECPNCHKPLTLVQIQVTKVVEWIIDDEDKESEDKFVDNGQGARSKSATTTQTWNGGYFQTAM